MWYLFFIDYFDWKSDESMEAIYKDATEGLDCYKVKGEVVE
jgi:hypothetical protein